MLSLARWDDPWGCTSGWWLVREVHGLSLYRTTDLCWAVQSLQTKDTNAERVWGKNADLRQAQRLLEKSDGRAGGFADSQQFRFFIHFLIISQLRTAKQSACLIKSKKTMNSSIPYRALRAWRPELTYHLVFSALAD